MATLLPYTSLFRSGVVGAQQYRHQQREHLRGLPQSRRQAGEAEGPCDRRIGHRIGTGVGRQGARHMRPAAREDETVDELRPARMRSEEHTSELQSLMRISYAVFCLKKKQPTN